MDTFQVSDGTRFEYCQKGWSKIANLALLSIFFTAGVGGGIAGLVYDHSGRYLIASAIVVAISIYWLLTVLRSRMVIDRSGIEVRTAFQQQSANFNEISGYRIEAGRGGAYTVIRLKDGRPSIVVSHFIFDIDNHYRDWLDQFPILDPR
jgi:hypothetical protein